MLELLYPINSPKVIPPLRADMVEPKSRPEMLPVVEPSGEVTAQSARAYVHGGSLLLHPVVHLHILNRFGEIYLQKRASTKDFLPGMWDTAVGGHISYGEQVEEALYREASEEVGLTEFNPIFLESYIYENPRERELVCVFAAVGSFILAPDNFEVDEGRWWTSSEIEDNIGKGILTANFEGEFVRIKDKLQALL